MKIYDFGGRKNICGERVRQARVTQRISQADLAARLQIRGVVIERDSVSRLEIGTRFVPDYEIPALAEALNVSATWLLGLEESKENADRGAKGPAGERG